jgi:hypothetical protein
MFIYDLLPFLVVEIFNSDSLFCLIGELFMEKIYKLSRE